MPNLSLFPVRVPIGRITDGQGYERDVLMTPEFARALADLLVRVGGTDGLGNDDLAILDSFGDQTSPLAEIAQQLEELRLQVALLGQPNEPPSGFGPDFEINYSFVQPLTDWEHPGKIGAATANTGRFTQVISTVAIGTPPLIVTSTTKVTNLNVDQLDGGDWDSPGAIGGTASASGKFTTFGCNGAAPQASAALPAAAIDPATTQALANSIRTALIANGIGV